MKIAMIGAGAWGTAIAIMAGLPLYCVVLLNGLHA
jgi:glycerol-3-phosphate dehydrogenase